MSTTREVRVMRTAAAVLDIIRDRGGRGLPLEDVYRQLYNPMLYLLAYGKIYRNNGAMTPGSTPETVDGMSLHKIKDIIAALREERYRWTPVRRVYIEKKHSMKKRPLGIPTWSDKLLQEVIRMILEAYYEPQFSSSSHGFRPRRGCHTALMEIAEEWKGTVWFLEGDISRCFDSLDHQVLLAILREKIQDNRLLRLIENLLKAGYLEEWSYRPTYSGSPQGGIVSPILANVYLDRLDQFVEHTLIPAYTQGNRRAENHEYRRITTAYRKARQEGRTAEARALRQEQRHLPSIQTTDPAYRRPRYARYADDFLLGFAGPRAEAEDIKRQLRDFLRDNLKLELSEQKTLITHGRTSAARFLGYELLVQQSDTRRNRTDGRRSINGRVSLQVPQAVILEHCSRYLRQGKPASRYELTVNSEFAIIVQYQQEYRGLAEYYKLAVNRSRRVGRLRWVMEQSLTHTLARKLRISVPQVYDRFRTIIQTRRGPYKGLQVRVDRPGKPPLVANWGGVSLARVRGVAILNDIPEPPRVGRVEILRRLLANACELCGSQEQIEVHHIRHLRDVQRQGQAPRPHWAKVMASRRRKTLVLCHACHQDVHHGRFDGKPRI